jgi:hypothetical protein
MCVIGANNYSDTRDELLSLEECAQTKETYGQEVGLPVEAEGCLSDVMKTLQRPFSSKQLTIMAFLIRSLWTHNYPAKAINCL